MIRLLHSGNFGADMVAHPITTIVFPQLLCCCFSSIHSTWILIRVGIWYKWQHRGYVLPKSTMRNDKIRVFIEQKKKEFDYELIIICFNHGRFLYWKKKKMRRMHAFRTKNSLKLYAIFFFSNALREPKLTDKLMNIEHFNGINIEQS